MATAMGSPVPATGDQDSLELHSPFQEFLPFPRTSDSEAPPCSHAPAAQPGQHPAPASPASAQGQHAATLHSTCSLPARRTSPAAEEASAPLQAPLHSSHSSHHSRGSLESVLSCRLTAAELMGPREVRTLLPGVQTLLRACGVESQQGNELPIVKAPRGINLKEALDRLTSSDIARQRSGTLSGHLSPQGAQQPGGSTRPATPTTPAPTPQATPGAAVLVGPRQPSSPGGAPLRTPAAGGSGSKAATPLRPASPSSPGAAARAAVLPATEAAQMQAEVQQESSAKENQAQREEVPGGDLAAGAERAERDGDLGVWEAAEPEVAVGSVEGRQQRPWTVDGTPGSLTLTQQRMASLDAQWQARSAARMWPMLAPFVPRILRQEILSPSPKCRSISEVMGAATDSPDAGFRLTATMGPCVELLPAAVVIADITGFTALTEALSTKGSAGVELLTKCMNRYFSQVIELLLRFQGDIIKFAGDSIIVAFWPTEEEAGGEDGGLRAATLRAVSCVRKLTDDFGAMRMLPTGDAIPVPREERAKPSAEQDASHAPEGEWFEDFVHRAESFFVTGPEFLIDSTLKPVTSFIQGAARPVGTVLHEAARPVSAILHETSGAASMVGRRLSTHLAGSNKSRQEVPDLLLKRSKSTPETVDEAADADGSPEQPSQPDHRQGSEADGTTGTPSFGARRRIFHSRSISSGLLGRLSQVSTPRLARRVPGDAAPLDRPQADAAKGQDTNGATASNLREDSQLHQDLLSKLTRLSGAPVLVRPPELPHRNEDSSRDGGSTAGIAVAEGVEPTGPQAVQRMPTAQANALQGHTASPRPEDSGVWRRAHSPGTGRSRLAQAASASGYAGHSPRSPSQVSKEQQEQLAGASLQNFPALPPIKARVTEDVPGYELVTVTAVPNSSRSETSTAATPVAATPAEVPGTGSKSGSLLRSLRFGRILKKAKGAARPMNLLLRFKDKVEASPASAPASSRLASGLPRSGSAVSSASGISSLDSLAALSHRFKPSADHFGTPPASPPHSPSKRLMWRRPNMSGSNAARHTGSLGAVSSVKEGEKLVLSLKVMVGAGTVSVFHVGGGQQSSVGSNHNTPRWEFFIGDPPLPLDADGQSARQPIAQLSGIEPFAHAGEAILSQEVAALVGDACVVEQLPGGAVRLVEVVNGTEPHMQGDPGPDGDAVGRATQEAAKEVAALKALPDFLQGRALQILRTHLLENVRLRIEAGHIDYVNEIRPCTVLFLGFPSLSYVEGQPSSPMAAAELQLSKVQTAVDVVQRKMRHYDGSFVQFRCDEKGFLAICAFGLPGRSHEDGVARGIQAALSIVEAMKRRSDPAFVGVTTGQLFCAMVGSMQRSEYTVFGDAINLSARLMVKAKDGLASILCDSATHLQATSKAHYQALEPLRVKGKRLPVEIYAVSPLQQRRQLEHTASLPGSANVSPSKPPPLDVPRSPVQLPDLPSLLSTHYSDPATTGATAATPMIGRELVLAAIDKRVGQLVEERMGGVILVEGEAGMGKTRLVEEVQHSELGGMYDRCNMFAGWGRADRRSQSLYPWRRIFQELFVHDRAFGQLYSLRGTNPQEQHVVVTELGRRMKEAYPGYEEWVPLLADALDLPESEFPVVPPHMNQALSTPLPAPREPPAQTTPQATPLPLASAPSRALRQEERDFVVGWERPRSFAVRLKRSLSASTSQQQLRASSARAPAKQVPPSPDSPASAPSHASRSSSEMSQLSIKPHPATVSRGTLLQQATPDSLMRTLTTRAVVASPAGHEKEVSSHYKSKLVQELLVGIICQFTEAYGPLILILEDLHFFDTGSWKLLGAVLDERSEQVLLVTTHRPIFGSVSPLRQLASKEMLYHNIEATYSYLLRSHTTLRIVLQPFTLEQTRQYISLALGGLEVTNEMAQLVWEKSSGLPAFIEQLVVFLKSKLLQASLEEQQKRGDATQAGGVMPGESLHDLLLNAMDLIRNTVSISSTITDRVDRLRPEEQLTLKVASVMGLTVYADLLQVAHPQHPTPQQVDTQLRNLEAANFLKQESPDEPMTWRFCQVLGRDVVYNLVPVGLQRDWHGRLAFSMEICQVEHQLPASTIAYHYAASCKGIEVAQWWRTMKAVQYWEKSAMEAISRGAYADGLPLLQNAQELGTMLAEYFGTDEKTVTERLRQLTTPVDKALSTLPSGLLSLPTSSSLASIYGSLDMGRPEGVFEVTSPLIPQLRRIHWERCMAAMCVASGISVPSLDQAMLHCLRALVLLGVPMPWDQAYLAKQRWWHCSFDACYVAGLCCFSSRLPEVGEVSQGEAGTVRIGEQGMANLEWLSQPGTLVGGMEVPASLLVRKAQELRAQQRFSSVGSGAVGDLGSGGGGGSSGVVMAGSYQRASAAADHVAWWQQTQLPVASRPPSCAAFPRLETLPETPKKGWQRQQQGQGQGQQGFEVEMGTEASLVSGPSAAYLQPSLPSLSIPLPPSPFASASLVALHSPATSGAATSGPGLHLAGSQPLPAAEAPAGTHGGTSAHRIPAAVGAQSGAGQREETSVPAGGSAPLEVSPRRRPERQSQSIPAQWLPRQHGGGSGRTVLHGSSSAVLFAGPTYGKLRVDEAVEAAVVLDILCTVLLIPQHIDEEGLKYVMWVCRRLQGERVRVGSLYWSTWLDAANALHHHRRQARPNIMLKPLTSMVGFLRTGSTAGKH